MDSPELYRLDAWSDWIISLGAVFTLAMGFFRWVWPRWRRFWNKVGGVSDAILGREAIVDRITGKELVPAQPGLGVRQATAERQLELLTVTVTKLVDQQNHQLQLEERLDAHDGRIEILEKATMERLVNRMDSVKAWEAMSSALDATPPPPPPAVDE